MSAGPMPAASASLDPMLPRPFRVVDRHSETDDVVTIRFEPTDGSPPLRFEPGQFTMVYVFGVGEVPLSIAGDPQQPQMLVHTVRDVGAVTSAIYGLAGGDAVGVRGPYGTGWPVSEAAGGDVVIVAGGIGLASLRPAILHLLHHRSRFGAISIIYGSRSPTNLLYEPELHTWRSRFDMEVEVTVDRSAEGWFGDVGVVTTLLPRIAFDPEKTMAMVCGPEIMMRVVARELMERDVAPDRVFVSLERNMKCAVGFCGHCQFGPDFICRDGPVLPYAAVADRMRIPEL